MAIGIAKRAAVTTGLAVAVVCGSAVAASAAQPGITSVTFSGVHGPGVASPTVTITGSGFGAKPPKGTDDSVTTCGTYTNNGKVYNASLYFMDDNNFEAGYNDATGANCVGVIVKSWSPTQVVLSFGSAYGSFAHWYLTNGDGYALSIKHALWGGTVSGLS